MKVIIFSHGHPRFSKGGGEIAAYYLHQGIQSSGTDESWFIARAPAELLPADTPLTALSPREYLVGSNANGMDLAATVPLTAGSDLEKLLVSIKPDVVHFHHYFMLGVELIRLVRRACPTARIVLTLHEFLAICINNGQMLKTNGNLCHQYSPRECHKCFPDRSPEWIFGRERYIKAFFDDVDYFLSPSEFLRKRYIEWGIDAARISVMENGLPEGPRLPLRTLREGEIRGRFAFFAQINPYKGVDVVLEAFASLPEGVRQRVTLDVFGGGLESQSAEFRARVAALLENTQDVVRMHGSYEPEEMPRLMAEVDWAVMGSIWWENSPLVIQEAYKFGRPVICPDIGGMAEKVVPGTGGYHYRARDAASLRALVMRLVEDPALFDTVHARLPAYLPVGKFAEKHLRLYQTLGRTSANERESATP